MRHAITGIGNYQVTNDINLFAEMSYAHNRVESQLAPTPFSEGMDVDLRNPYMPEATRALFSTFDTDGDSHGT